MKAYILGRTKEEVQRLIPENKIKTVQLGDVKICIARQGNKVFAFEEACPHRKASLSQGMINKFQEIVCPLHGYQFDLNSGKCQQSQCSDLKIYKTETTEDGLKIFL